MSRFDLYFYGVNLWAASVESSPDLVRLLDHLFTTTSSSHTLDSIDFRGALTLITTIEPLLIYSIGLL